MCQGIISVFRGRERGGKVLHAFLLLGGVDSGLFLGDDDRHSLFGDGLEKN